MSQTLNDTNGNGAMDALRSQAYGFFAAAMEYPEGELTQWIREGQISTRARELFCTIYPELAGSIEWSALAEAGVDDELSVEYTRIFDVGGADGPPCALNSGAAKGDARMGLLEELVRFYNYFGLTAAGTEANELPDHLSTQFEFLHFLIHQQLEAEAAGEVADDFIRAQRDFINRHPGSWVPLLHTQLKDSKAPAYYLAMGALMERFILLEQRYIELRVSRLPAPTPHAEPAEGQMPGEVTAARSASPEGDGSVIQFYKKPRSPG